MAGRQHLHHDDAPLTLAILTDLLGHRASFPEGYEPTEHGAWVDFDALVRSWLSGTEVAAVHIARGCAIAERHGGLTLEVAGSVRAAVDELTSRWTATPNFISLTDPAIGVRASAAVGLDPCDLDGPARPSIPDAEPRARAHCRAELPEASESGPGVGL